MRIAFASTEFFKDGNLQDGGLANYLYKICLGLKEAGHDIVVFIPGTSIDSFEYKGVEVVSVSFSVNKLFRFLDKITCLKLQPLLFAIWTSYYLNKTIRKYHKKNKIDIIQYPNLGGLGLFKPRNIPSVLRASSYTKLWNDADEIDSQKIRFRQLVFVENLVIRRNKYIFSPSNFISNYLSRKFGKKILTIRTPYPVYEENAFSYKLRNEIQGLVKGRKFLLYYGGIGIWKGIPELLNIIPIFLNDNDVAFVLLGNPKGKSGKENLKQIAKLEVDYKSRFFYYPAQPHNELIPLIDASHAVVLPSRVENLSNACIESMSRGKIVLGTDGASFEELIIDGVNGFLFKKMNEADLLQKLTIISRLKSDVKLEIEENARAFVKKALAPDIVLAEHVNYYHRVLSTFKKKH